VRPEYRFAGLIPVQIEILLEAAQDLPHRNFGMREEWSERYDFGLLFLSVHFLSGGAERKWTPVA
jgi:hypothetical protein